MSIRILIADDHAVVREGVRELLKLVDGFEVVGEAADGHEAIALCSELHPDLVLMDIAMPGLGGLEATIAIKKDDPRIKVLVLSQYDDPEYVRRFLGAGVDGYVLKRAAGSELVAAIRAIERGGLPLDPAIARDAITNGSHRDAAEAAADPYEALTDREKQVLKLTAEGCSNKQIAALLDISVKTAISHREHLMRKLQLHNRTDLIRFALRTGVIRAD